MKLSLTKFCLVAIALAAVVPVFAGPMPMAEKNVAPVAPACDWTGFYIGVNAGITEYRAGFTDFNYWWNGSTTTYEKPAFTGGGQVGYNYQWRDLVFGIEADFSGLAGADHKHTLVDCAYCDAAETAEAYLEESWTQRAKVDFMGTLRGRFGISFLDNKALIYVTGGGALAHGTWDIYYFDEEGGDYPAGEYNVDWHGDDWRWGWVGGVGIEYALNCHWSVRAEALYTWLEHDNQGIDCGRSGSEVCSEGYTVAPQRFEDDLWSYRVGINYKFSGFGGH